ncbi:MAG: copper resistance protein B [Caulobacteraceae bacterium]|nr:copper resistance protein B [Caulobacteraceae bacterium]
MALAILATASAARAQMSMGPVTASAPYGLPMEDDPILIHGLLEQAELRGDGQGADLRWMGEAWVGNDESRLWLKSEGLLRPHGKVEDGQTELLYSRPVSPFFDLRLGGRYDLDSGPGRGWAAAGISGLAPYRIHVSAMAYAGDRGRAAAKLEASSDLLLTQRLILSPQIEMNLYSKGDPARRIGPGLSDLDAGLRLRYEITRKFAPYIGVSETARFGQTADMTRRAAERSSDTRFVLGIRSWF